MINTSSKTGAVTVNLTVHDVDNNIATRTADPNSLDNAQHDDQQQMGQSMETTEEDESNTEDSKTMQANNNNTPVLESTVRKKTIFSILENIAYTTYLIKLPFFVCCDIGVSISTRDAVIRQTTTKALVQ